ncbi:MULTISPECIES: hypothetical protein [Staphylococcus]|uniref:hypothetical protein n=1 Tax=Staphylococcus TaxID=1279 RepID=UPI001867F06D|nr:MULTISPECIES: hypothetical protein [Staphylococcus]
MNITKKQAEFLEIMKSLGYEFDENSEKEGVEIQLENDSYCISANEIKNNFSPISIEFNRLNNYLFDSNISFKYTNDSNDKSFTKTYRDNKFKQFMTKSKSMNNFYNKNFYVEEEDSFNDKSYKNNKQEDDFSTGNQKSQRLLISEAA